MEVRMSEKFIEAKLVKAVKTLAALAPKFVSPGLDGSLTDSRFSLRQTAFIELKAYERNRALCSKAN
jgi:hypothetical protein